MNPFLIYTSVQSSSVAQSCLMLCNPMDCSTPGFPIQHQHSELAQTHAHRVSDAIQPSHPLLSPSPPAFNLSQHQVLQIRWPKYWSFSFSISPSNAYSGLISFRMHWFDLLIVQGTLKSLLQHHSSKASILWCSALLWSNSHIHTWLLKNHSFDETYIVEVMSLLFNMLCRLAITFLPRNKCLNSMAAVTICSDFGAQESKVAHCFHCFPIYLLWSDGTRCHDLSFLNVEF